MPLEDPQTRLNQAWWNERAAFHRQTPLYQKHLARLQGGGLSLLPLEVDELGDIRGRQVLHLQCHIGTDTLSLARLGATVTGVDFSEVAIEEARQLSSELGIPARFECCEIGALSARYSEAFDLVFSSHGVLSWLPDLTEWAAQIAACLRPGGHFYLSESHPLVWALADDNPADDGRWILGYPYLSRAEACTFVESGSYADRARSTEANETREWSWGLGDVVNALLGVGLRIEWLREHPVGFFAVNAAFQEGEDGHYRLPPPWHGHFPLTFTVRATKP